MSNKISIETPEGDTIQIDAEVARGYKQEAFEILGREANAKSDFKEAIELQAEGLGIEKKYWSKYVKTSFKQAVKEQSAQAELFAALDDATEEVLEVGEE